jgi:uncharacterized protein (DUF302 family)
MNKLVSAILFFSLLMGNTQLYAAAPNIKIEDTVVKMALSEGISFDDAVSSMKLRANTHNMKLVAELPLSKQVQAMGIKSRRMDIYQFCDALMAQKMVEANINFAAYLPCRIALIEDKNGKGWLVMMNLDMMLQGATLSDELKVNAEKVRDVLMDIMQAGANGDL